ncbi:DegV family protein [Priestia koreensis]|uniref:DegV family protein n=1 Tax=Priestia koreensis TaxID=284581 RepID=UPI00345A854D
MKTAIITDSTAYISKEEREKWNIRMIPLSVIINGETYREDIDLEAEEFFELVREHKALPTTSQPPIGQFVELFEELSKDYDAAIVITLSSGISGTYQNVVAAGNMVEGIDVRAFDSEISCMVQGFYAIEGAKMAQEERDVNDIMARLDEMMPSVRAYFMVDDLGHLQRGGRLSATQAIMGSLLQIKPLLHFVDKKIVPFEKIRTRKKALKRIYDLLGEDVKAKGPIRAVIIHANRPHEAEEILQDLQQQFPTVEFSTSYFGAVIGTHLGEGAVGIGWYEK